jgi:hypothetical protein
LLVLLSEKEGKLVHLSLLIIALIILYGTIPIFYPRILYSETVYIPYHFFYILFIDYLFFYATLYVVDSKIAAGLDFFAFLASFLGSYLLESDPFIALLDLVVYPIISIILIVGDKELRYRIKRKKGGGTIVWA